MLTRNRNMRFLISSGTAEPKINRARDGLWLHKSAVWQRTCKCVSQDERHTEHWTRHVLLDRHLYSESQTFLCTCTTWQRGYNGTHSEGMILLVTVSFGNDPTRPRDRGHICPLRCFRFVRVFPTTKKCFKNTQGTSDTTTENQHLPNTFWTMDTQSRKWKI